MRITVCALHTEADQFEDAWQLLVAHVREKRSELLLVPEMPFAPWMPGPRAFDAAVWDAAVAAHDRIAERCAALPHTAVLGSRPVTRDGQRRNEAFVWDAAAGYRAVHHKYYLPDESGYWEASWYARGDGTFTATRVGEAQIGFLICSELWFTRHCRSYAQQGVQIVACPRATPRSEYDKWLAGGRAAAVMAGAFCCSSCHTTDLCDAAELGGHGWIIGPNGGIIAETSRAQPFLTIDLRLAKADAAKQTYPRYIPD